ncbi:MAG: FAD-dependent oxidoreductase [Gemmatimonadetes bacterium]|jgi:D-amino-acid dehydrogenase|nr:FAD-dependent oxidoreductase [Gemmatimonadota bacterium]
MEAKAEGGDVLVVGGGVVGVCVAYYLARAGRRVCLVERGEVCSGCSHGNAGLLVPSHSVPLAAPGVVAKSLKWMFNPASPFYIKPRLDRELLSWLWRFNRACNRRQVQRAMPLIRDLSMESLRLYDELAADGTEFGLEHKGVLMLYKTEAGLREQVADGKAMGEFGIEARELSLSEISELSPNLSVDALGGVYYPQDGHVTPMQLVPEIARRAREMGVEVHTHTEVLAFERSGARISRVVTTRGDFTPEEVVLTAGSWSGVLARELGLRLPIQGGKGYSITFKRPLEAPSLPIVCGEAKIGVTPMIDALRFAGTLELAGLDLTISRQRVAAVLSGVPLYLPDLKPEEMELVEIWRGLRPCTPDGLPFLGRARHIDNLTVAAGHAMIGVSLGPVTGKLVAEVVSGEKPSIDLDLLKVDRYA